MIIGAIRPRGRRFPSTLANARSQERLPSARSGQPIARKLLTGKDFRITVTAFVGNEAQETGTKEEPMSMNEEISQAIQKNLPAAVASELKSYIEQAEQDKGTISRLTGQIKELQTSNESEYKARLVAQEKLDAHAALDKREAEITKREITLSVQIADLKREAAEQRAADIHGLVSTVFRNPTIKRSLFKNEMMNGQYDSQAGRTVYTPSGQSNTTEEIVED